MSKRKCVNCRHRKIEGSSSFCEVSGNFLHYSTVFEHWCKHWAKLKTDYERWEKNVEMLKSGALGDVNSSETLLRYWQMQERAGYPNASENVKYFEDMVRKESEDTEGEG